MTPGPQLWPGQLGKMEDHTQSILDDSNKGSFKELFWQQQMQTAKQKAPRQMKWHPQMIRWCLHLKLTSGGGYTTLRESGLLKLPSERVLQDYTHYIPPCTGFQEGVTEQLREYAKTDQLEEWQKFIVVTFDEWRSSMALCITSIVNIWLGLLHSMRLQTICWTLSKAVQVMFLLFLR